MVYGIAKMLNFAHGDVIMVGAYICFFTMTACPQLLRRALPAPWSLPGGVLLAMVVCTVLGMVIERLAYKPLRQAPVPGRADHRHRRELFLAEQRPAALDLQPQVLPLRGGHRLYQPAGRPADHHLRGHGDRGCLHRHHAGAHLVYRHIPRWARPCGPARRTRRLPSSWAST